ncbi:hypothetical protein ZOSMA_42G00210 [Zostera marina]|uniref:Protein MIZU-KUSSEI 1 n=1 Tax=Zostera marina TaxID=29655 RepID=A0A0K9P461_ZOSMR|nr:hypothetical protein ZOSMA_42G00210 [Zostera marina]
MPSIMEPQKWSSLLRPTNKSDGRRGKIPSSHGGIFRMFKLLPILTTGCKMAALLSGHRNGKGLLGDKATTVTLFGHRRGRISLVIQDNPHSPPTFLIELPLLMTALHKEMESGLMKLALESETRTNRKKLVEEYVWGVYVNGRKSGYSIRRKEASDDERYVMGSLRGVSMGAGVLPGKEKEGVDEEMTYMRARFEKVVGSKDSETLYMINPDGSSGAELSIFLVRMK